MPGDLAPYLIEAIAQDDRPVVEKWLSEGWADPEHVNVALRRAAHYHRPHLLVQIARHADQGIRFSVYWAVEANHAESLAAALTLTPPDLPRHGWGSHADSFTLASRRGFLGMAHLLAPHLDMAVVAGPALKEAAAYGQTGMVEWLLRQEPTPEARVAAYHRALQRHHASAARILSPTVPDELLVPNTDLNKSLAQSLLQENPAAIARLLPKVPRSILAGMVHRWLQGGGTEQTRAAVDRLTPHATPTEQDTWLTWAPHGSLPAMTAAHRARDLAGRPSTSSRPRRRT